MDRLPSVAQGLGTPALVTSLVPDVLHGGIIYLGLSLCSLIFLDIQRYLLIFKLPSSVLIIVLELLH